MTLLMDKRGMGHVELVLSFVIFVAALAFALFVFNPADTDKFVETSLTYAFNEILKNTTIEIETVYVKIDNNSIIEAEDSNSSLPIETLAIQIPNIKANMISKAKTIEGKNLTSERVNDVVRVRSNLPDRWRNIDFISVAFSEDFFENTVGEGIDDYYIISSSENKRIISEKKLLDLKQFYESDYFNLKSEFNLPDRANFGFSLEFADGEKINAEREVPGDLEIFSDKKRLEILRTNGEIVFADLIVRIW